MTENAKFETRIQEEIAKRKEEHNILPIDTTSGQKIYPFVRFIGLDGREEAFSYSHLTKISFKAQDTANVVVANFTKELVTIKGYQLHAIYLGMINHTISEVIEEDTRYLSNASDIPVITEIKVEESS